jgi:hypothetical protein
MWRSFLKNIPSVIYVLILAVVFIIHVWRPEKFKLDDGTVVLVILLVLPFLFRFVSEFEGFGLSVKFREKIEELEATGKENRERIDQIFSNLLSPRLRKEILDFARHESEDEPVTFTSAYKSELMFLHNLGFIELMPGKKGFDDLPERDLITTWFRITALGEEYLKLWEPEQKAT